MTDFRRLPNLAALRAFEAAARLGNFSRAAEEVHVTHGAISHQVRALEQELGVDLFVRNGKRITVTPAGAQFASAVRQALSEIAGAAETLKASARQQRLTVTALPSLASRWLAPRLGRFIDLHPQLEVILQSSNQLTDLAREGVDLGVRFGQGRYPGLITEKLMDDYYYPVASPRFNGGRLPRNPAALAGLPLLRCDDERWRPWFEAAGIDLPEPAGGLVFEDSSMLLRAAAEGHGIALGRHVLAAGDIQSGELVRLFDVAIPSTHAYFISCPPESWRKPQVQAFFAWLLEEAGKDRPAL